MTPEAKSALLAAKARIGATVYSSTSTTIELEARGFVSRNGNLTEAGKRARATLAKQMEDEAFGG